MNPERDVIDQGQFLPDQPDNLSVAPYKRGTLARVLIAVPLFLNGCGGVTPTQEGSPIDTKPALTDTLPGGLPTGVNIDPTQINGDYATKEVVVRPFHPIELIKYEELKANYPDKLTEIIDMIQGVVPGWKTLSDDEFIIDFYSFNRENQGKLELVGTAAVVTVDGYFYLYTQINEAQFSVQPLDARADDQGNLSFFTYRDGKKVMFLADTSTGVTAYLPDGSTVDSSEGILKDPNARPNRMASGIPFTEILEGSLNFDIQTGELTAKDSEGKDLVWDGTNWIMAPVIGRDLKWMGEPAPLGLLGEVIPIPETYSSFIYASGLYKGSEERTIDVSGQPVVVTAFTFDFGKDKNGEPVIGSFIGSSEPNLAMIPVTDTHGKRLPWDPTHKPTYITVTSVTVNELKQMLTINKQYALELYVEFFITRDMCDNPVCFDAVEISKHLGYNIAIVEQLRSGTTEAADQDVGWLTGIVLGD